MIQQIRRVFKESLDLKTSECCCGTRQVNQHCNLVKMGTDKGIPTQWQGGWGRWRGLPKGTGTMMRRGCLSWNLKASCKAGKLRSTAGGDVFFVGSGAEMHYIRSYGRRTDS